ncbi:MAG: sulfur carrier protein ThiS [Oscillospiraceae bacterium]|nr:sulfur carrier protein ThiS [Oscillospiraceae bacterium]
MVTVNGKPADVSGRSIAQIVTDGGYHPLRVAVELNEQIVPKAQYASTVVQDGDKVEIVGFVGGG